MSAATTFGALALGANFRFEPTGPVFYRAATDDPESAIPDETPVYPLTDADYLEHLRGEIRAECISWGELADLQDMAELIDPDDVELLEWAGVPEFPDERAAFFAERAREAFPDADHDDPDHTDAPDGFCVDCAPDLPPTNEETYE